jgi:phage baseplate assembly protein V
MIGIGQITAINDNGPVQMAQVEFGYLELRDNTPVIYHFGFAANPPVGSNVLANFVAGDRGNGVVAGTNHQALRMRGLGSGECAIYDSLGRSVYLSAAGIVVNGNGGPVSIANASTVTVTATAQVVLNAPTVQVNGNLSVSGNINATGTIAGH